MKEARHVATGKIVKADQVDYKDFYGIFECPECNAVLSLRKGYTRDDGVYIGATFVHPNSNTQKEKNCSFRNELNFNQDHFIVSSNLSRNQFRNLLKENLLSLLKESSEISGYEYCDNLNLQKNNYLSNDGIQKIRCSFIELCSLVIQKSRSLSWLKQSKTEIRNKIVQKIENQYESNLENIEEHINKVIWMIDFFINESNNTLGKLYIWNSLTEALMDYILGSSLKSGLEVITIPRNADNFKELESILDKYLINDESSYNSEIFNEINQFNCYICGFSVETLYLVHRYIFYDNNQINLVQEDFVYSDNEKINQNKVKYFSDNLFNWIINFLIKIDWERLLKIKKKNNFIKNSNQKYRIINECFTYNEYDHILDDYRAKIQTNKELYLLEISAGLIRFDGKIIGEITASNKDFLKWFPTDKSYSDISKKINQNNKKLNLILQKDDLGNRIALLDNSVVAIEGIEAKISVEFDIYIKKKLEIPFYILDGIEKQLNKYCRKQNKIKEIKHYYTNRSENKVGKLIEKLCLQINTFDSQQESTIDEIAIIIIQTIMIDYIERHFSDPKEAKKFLLDLKHNNRQYFICLIYKITGFDLRTGRRESLNGGLG